MALCISFIADSVGSSDQAARHPENRRARGNADLALALLHDEPEIRDVHRVAVLRDPGLHDCSVIHACIGKELLGHGLDRHGLSAESRVQYTRKLDWPVV